MPSTQRTEVAEFPSSGKESRFLEETERPPVLITDRMSIHAGASGYDRLADYLHANTLSPPHDWTFVTRATARSLRFLIKRSGSYWYHRQNLICEMKAARLWFSNARQVFHFLYGENSYRYLGLLKRFGTRSNAIVCTYHTPESRFVEVVRDRRHLSRIDAAIVVSTVQIQYMTDLVGNDRVFYVPHGIDTDHYRPLSNVRDSDRLQCLFVGSHLRDIETLAKVAGLLRENKDVRFKVVTRPTNFAKLEQLENVELLSGVSDQSLLSLYQQSNLLVFPLLDCTANNSLLEAMACGLPIVTTDLEGVRDYVCKDGSMLTRKGDAREMADVVEHLARDRDAIRRMRAANRMRALELSWPKVARTTQQIYRDVAKN